MISNYSLYLYGSSARGDAVAHSDVDILVLFDSGSSVNKKDIIIPSHLRSSVGNDDISYYSFERIKEMYKEGHLFAWHLHNEARYINGGPDKLGILGKPNVYQGFNEDAVSLLNLLKSIPENVKENPRNVVYEAGLAYVCARNIAMSASYYAPNGLTFSAYAPFHLGYDDNQFPLSPEKYDALRNARLSGSRGLDAPDIHAELLLPSVEKLLIWCKVEIERIARKIQ